MNGHLVDTSVLTRLANAADATHLVALHAVSELHQRGDVLYITAQNLVEFRNVATRPLTLNGLGMTIPEAEAEAAVFERRFPLLPETPDIFPAWKQIVAALGIIGKQVHDARLVAVCHVHKVTHILTFNAAHFARFSGYGQGLLVVDPATV